MKLKRANRAVIKTVRTGRTENSAAARASLTGIMRANRNKGNTDEKTETLKTVVKEKVAPAVKTAAKNTSTGKVTENSFAELTTEMAKVLNNNRRMSGKRKSNNVMR